MGYGTSMVASGRTYDLECGRSSHRLLIAQQLLIAGGCVPTYPKHAVDCDCNPDKPNRNWRPYGDTYRCSCGVGIEPRPTWPEWARPEVFTAAWNLAHQIQQARHDHAAGQIEKARKAAS